MPNATAYEGDCKVFTADGEEWVVARDPADAEAVYLATGAMPLKGVDDKPIPWTECDPSKEINWQHEEEGPSGKVTYAELSKKGRGYLGSANY